MYEGSNPTAQRSQQWIIQALLSLMNQKEYAQISVKDICEEADLSRQTFYNLFSSKDDVLRACIEQEIARIFNEVETSGSLSLRDMVGAFVWLLSENRKLFSQMIDQGLESIVSEEIVGAVGLFAHRFSQEEDPEILDYSVAFLGGALAQTMLCWFKKDGSMDVDQLTDFLERALTGSIYRFEESAAEGEGE